MIKIGPLAADSGYYTRDASPAAYYGSEGAGRTAGGAAAAAGLSETVTPAELGHLLAGRSVDGARDLLPHHPRGKARHRGRELHAAPHKSVSALYGVVTAVAALAILQASEDALRGTLRQAEAEAAVFRRGRGGRRHELGKLVFVIYTHRTSRAGDPQLHHHVVIANLVLRPDGTWGALHNRQLYRSQKRLTATYNRLLRDNLRKLGIDARLEGGRCVVAGVPQSLCDEFSSRRREVERGKGVYHPKDREAGQKAAWATRGAKLRTPEGDLRKRWAEAARKHGYDPRASQLGKKLQARRDPAPDTAQRKPERDRRLPAPSPPDRAKPRAVVRDDRLTDDGKRPGNKPRSPDPASRTEGVTPPSSRDGGATG